MEHGTRKRPVVLENVAHFEHWADTAPKGSWAVYHLGDLSSERMLGMHSRPAAMGKLAWELYSAGLFLITQRRPAGASPSVFEYMIIKRRLPK